MPLPNACIALLWNKRFIPHLLKSLYCIAQQTVAQVNPAYSVVVSALVNFEKAHTKASEGVSTVHKSTPPELNGKARLVRKYPAMTATVVNTPIPAISYFNRLSYQDLTLCGRIGRFNAPSIVRAGFFPQVGTVFCDGFRWG